MFDPFTHFVQPPQPPSNHQSILCIIYMSPFFSFFKDTTFKLHYSFNYGFVPNNIPLQLYNLFLMGGEVEVCVLSHHHLEGSFTHPLKWLFPNSLSFHTATSSGHLSFHQLLEHSHSLLLETHSARDHSAMTVWSSPP